MVVKESRGETQRSLEELSESLEIRDEALRIMEERDPVKYILVWFNMFHPGDMDVAKVLLLSLASQSVRNSSGIQPHIVGKSTAGKTHCCSTMLHLVPQEYWHATTLSDKSLYYMADSLNPGTTIFSDDVKLSEALEGTIRRATGEEGFQKGTTHTTVIGRKAESKKIPRGMNFWLTSVDIKQSEQLLTRQYVVGIDESWIQDIIVDVYISEQYRKGKINLPLTKEVKICREILRQIKQPEPFRVKIPFTEHIGGIDISNRRNKKMFLDMISALAVLRNKQRKKSKNGKIIADKQDFEDAKILWNKYAMNYRSKFTPMERKIVDTILIAGSTGIGLGRVEIGELVGLHPTQVYNLIHGRDGKYGLVQKGVLRWGVGDHNKNIYSVYDLNLHTNEVYWKD